MEEINVKAAAIAGVFIGVGHGLYGLVSLLFPNQVVSVSQSMMFNMVPMAVATSPSIELWLWGTLWSIIVGVLAGVVIASGYNWGVKAQLARGRNRH